MSIKHRIFFTFTVMLIIPILFLVTLAVHSERQSLRGQVKNSLYGIVGVQKSRVELVVKGYEDIAASITSQTKFRSELGVYNMAHSASSTQGTVSSINRITNDAKNVLPQIDEIVVYDDRGGMIANDDYHSFPKKISLEELKERENETLVKILRDEDVEGVHVFQVIRRDDVELGAIGILFSKKDIVGLIQDNIGISETGKIILAYKDQGDIYTINSLTVAQKADALVDEKSISALLIQAFNTNLSFSKDVVNDNDEPMFVATAYLPGVNWALLVEIDEKEVFRSANEFAAILDVISLITVIIGLLMAWVITRSITLPLLKMTNIAKEISKGNQSVVSQLDNLSGKTEVGILASSFSQLLHDLGQSHDTLEMKVEERTKEALAARENLERMVSNLERMNSLIVGREKKMNVLKEKLSNNEGDQGISEQQSNESEDDEHSQSDVRQDKDDSFYPGV